MKIYITYGKGNSFDKEKLPKVEDLEIELSPINKIQKTLWGSPIDANYGWKDWCESESFNTNKLLNSFQWTLKPEAKVLYIEDLQDIFDKVPFIEAPLFKGSSWKSTFVDFKKIISEYDAMEISMDNGYLGHMFVDKREECFNSWDCDSIMVFNREMIVPL